MYRNKQLFNTKLKLVKENHDLGSLNHEVTLNFHGVPLTIFSDEISFIEAIKSFVPNTWLSSGNSSTEIYLFNPIRFSIRKEDWGDEESQDCIQLENSSIAVQRDFTARKISEKKVLLFCEPLVGDGLFNFLRWFLPRKLLSYNRFLIHSSCVLDKQNKAHLFLGHSGAGKSTLSQLDKNLSRLSDDMNILFMNDNGDYRISPAAIGGTFKPSVGYDQSFELHSVNWIHQSPHPKRIELNRGESELKLLASITNVFWETLPQHQTIAIIKAAASIAKDCKFYDLYFAKDKSFWSLIE